MLTRMTTALHCFLVVLKLWEIYWAVTFSQRVRLSLDIIAEDNMGGQYHRRMFNVPVL